MKTTTTKLKSLINEIVMNEIDGTSYSTHAPASNESSGTAETDIDSAIVDFNLDALESDVAQAELNLAPAGPISIETAEEIKNYSEALDSNVFQDVAESILQEYGVDNESNVEVELTLSELQLHGLSQSLVSDIKNDVTDIIVKNWTEGIFRAADPARSTAPTFIKYIMRLLTTSLRALVFGFIDNAVLIIASHQINKHLMGKVIVQTPFGSLVAVGMMHEALGNAVSDVFGELLATPGLSMLESVVPQIGPDYWVTEMELTQAPKLIRILDVMSSTVGVFVGCILGAMILFLMDTYRAPARRAAELAAAAGAARYLGVPISTLSLAVLAGGLLHVGIRMWGASIYDMAKQDNTFKAVQGTFILILRLSGIITGGMNGKPTLIDPELDPYAREILENPGSQQTIGNETMWEILRRKIDRDIFDDKFSEENIRTWAAGETKPNLSRQLIQGLAQKLGYAGSYSPSANESIINESRWQKLAGII